MSDEMYNRLKKLANNETNLSDEEISEAVHNIIQNDFLDTTSTSEKINLGKIYDLLDKAKFAETCEIFPDSFELILLFLKYEKSPFKAFDILDMGLEREKKRLKTIQKFGKIDFDDEDDVCEKHPYLECLVEKIVALTSLGRLRQAEETCKEYFKMDKSDAAELHNLLFSIYACLEEDKKFFNLKKKYPQEKLESIFPLLVLSYKQGNDKLALECLNKLYKLNSQIFSYFEGIDILEENLPDKDMMDGIELNMYMVGHKFLLDSAPDLDIYIKENKSKVIKK